MLTRRHMLQASAAGLAAMMVPSLGASGRAHAAATATFEVMHSEAEWRKRLTDDQFAVLRQEGTERPFTSALLHEERKGQFDCAGCQLPLFASETKFDSGTGWPSFWKALPGSVNEITDKSYGMTRTAVNCHRCGGHLGHVFKDGPAPTGLRYCMNGVAMTFAPA
jgi:peptide-methionine (R)-S-oxide reductase